MLVSNGLHWKPSPLNISTLPVRPRSLLILPLLVATLIVSKNSSAEWDGGIEGGSIINDDQSSTRLRLKLTNYDRPLSHYIYADWIRSSGGDNSYEVGYKPRYWFTKKLYGFGDARLRVDKQLQIDREVLLLGGAGYQFFQTAENALWAEAGAGKRDTQFDNNTESDDTLTLLRGGFYQVLADMVRFDLDLNVLQGDTITETYAEAGVAVRIAGGALKYAYRVRNIKIDGLPDVEDSDSFVSFSYGF